MAFKAIAPFHNHPLFERLLRTLLVKLQRFPTLALRSFFCLARDLETRRLPVGDLSRELLGIGSTVQARCQGAVRAKGTMVKWACVRPRPSPGPPGQGPWERNA